MLLEQNYVKKTSMGKAMRTQMNAPMMDIDKKIHEQLKTMDILVDLCVPFLEGKILSFES